MNNYFVKNEAALNKATEETAPLVNDYVEGLKPSLIEKYPQIVDYIQDVEGRGLISTLRELYHSCYTSTNKDVIIKEGWGDYFVDARNGMINDIGHNINDIIHSAVQAPTLTEIVTPEVGALAFAVATVPVLFYYGIPVLTKAAASVNIAGKHIKENLHK